MTDSLREWRFGFQDYYDVFIWSFLPDSSPMDMYNVVITELRMAWRLTHPRDSYLHMEPLLRTLTREKDTMRTRKIIPGEDVESLWDAVTGDQVQFKVYSVQNDNITSQTADELGDSPYLFYNKASVVEDEILFPDEAGSNKKKKTPFREIKNGVSRVETSCLPSQVRQLEKSLALAREGKDPVAFLNETLDSDEDSIWALPKVWQTGFVQLLGTTLSVQQRKLLNRTGLDTINRSQLLAERLRDADFYEVMERDRSFGFKEAFHEGDFEPGSNEKYFQVQDQISALLKTAHTGATDWVLFLVEILDWLQLRADYDDYVEDPAAPGHVFFPESTVTHNVTALLKSDECESFRNSLLFNPQERSKSLPDRRSRTSYKYRDKKFWDEWKELSNGPRYFTDVYPLDWSMTVRPTIAKLYRAGLIAPAYCQNHPQIVPGAAIAATEPHRPDKLELFICFEDRYNNFTQTFPPFSAGPDQWTVLLPRAQAFAGKHQGARFALLRLWSAPHFYPLMIGFHNRQGSTFLDSVGRPWEWKFMPKDMPGSELSIHHTVNRRLELLKGQFGDRVYSRGDLILVMGEDATDLLKYCAAVTFAVQTKPWLREVDLWKSFINVDLDFLRQLDAYWLD
ncbi:hypothetical protein ACQKWADRAFT_330782 [Trichoderma austrokoningii]